MWIDLMAGVPNKPVVPEIECLMEGQAKLNNTQVRRKMGAAAADEVTQHLAHFAGQSLELREREVTKIFRRMDRGQDGGFRHVYR